VSRRLTVGSLVLVTAALVLSACSNPLHSDTGSDRLTGPELGACRDLDADDLTVATNDSPVVDCAKPHTAQTFAIGELPASTGTAYDDKRHGRFVYGTCSKGFREFIGADESLAMRVQLSWAWFRPSERGWDRGARWYRCDLVGGPDGAAELVPLPDDAKGLFSDDQPDAWLTCARGPKVAGSTKVPCTQEHDWRAVTTVKLGGPEDPYPGDRIVQVRSRDYCQASVGGWMHYPPDYQFGLTWFRADRWEAGNRRTICWAKTDR
jgi:hypothetical protein